MEDRYDKLLEERTERILWLQTRIKELQEELSLWSLAVDSLGVQTSYAVRDAMQKLRMEKLPKEIKTL